MKLLPSFFSSLNNRLKIFVFVVNSRGHFSTFTVEPRLATTPLIRPPRYYGHFILARKKAWSVIFLFKEPLSYDHPVNTTGFPWPKGGRINGVPLYHFKDRYSLTKVFLPREQKVASRSWEITFICSARPCPFSSFWLNSLNDFGSPRMRKIED